MAITERVRVRNGVRAGPSRSGEDCASCAGAAAIHASRQRGLTVGVTERERRICFRLTQYQCAHLQRVVAESCGSSCPHSDSRGHGGCFHHGAHEASVCECMHMCRLWSLHRVRRLCSVPFEGMVCNSWFEGHPDPRARGRLHCCATVPWVDGWVVWTCSVEKNPCLLLVPFRDFAHIWICAHGPLKSQIGDFLHTNITSQCDTFACARTYMSSRASHTCTIHIGLGLSDRALLYPVHSLRRSARVSSLDSSLEVELDQQDNTAGYSRPQHQQACGAVVKYVKTKKGKSAAKYVV